MDAAMCNEEIASMAHERCWYEQQIMFELALSNDRAFFAMCWSDFVHEGHEHTIIARSSEEIVELNSNRSFVCSLARN